MIIPLLYQKQRQGIWRQMHMDWLIWWQEYEIFFFFLSEERRLPAEKKEGGNVVIYGEQWGVQKSSWRSSKWIEKENWQDVWAASTKRSLQICGQICKPKTLSMPVDFASATSAAWEMERLLYAGLGFGLENTREWVKDTSCVCKRMTTTMNLRTHMLDKEVDEEGGWQCKKSGQWVGGL